MKRAAGALTLLVALVLGGARAAHAGTLTPDELARLDRGETVSRPQDLEEYGRRYVGGVTYTFVDTTADELLALLDDDEAWLEVLPRTKHAQRIAGDASNVWVQLHQGNALVDAAYTLHVQKEPAASRVRFWVDLTRPHDVEDAWGFYRWQDVRPGRVLLVYGALVDPGGVLRSMYEERLRAAMLEVPQRLRRYVAKKGASAWKLRSAS